MKLFACRGLQWPCKKSFAKTLLIMKMLTVIMLAFCLNLTAGGYGQNVAVSAKNVSLAKVLKEISRQTGYKFVYTEKLLKNSSRISISVKDAPLEEVLTQILKDQSLTYTILNEFIILKKVEHPLKDEKVNEAQKIVQTITGRIINDKGEPLGGATIHEKASSNSAVSMDGGNFSITVTAIPSAIIVSYVGYDTKEIIVRSNSLPAITMVLAGNNINDAIVVVGYGTQKKATLTGSVSTVNAQAFQNRGPIDNPLSVLQGQVPGVVVSRTSAQPGRQNWGFQIRGASSVNGTEPLVIVDDVPLTGTSALNTINPNDIESMSFLKDASAAIYGARAAGGVVLITTKKAKNGKPVIQYDGSFSQKLLGLRPSLMNSQQWGQSLMDALTADNPDVSAPVSTNWYILGQLFANHPDSMWINGNSANPGFGDVKDFVMFDNNWQNVLWGNANSTQHNLSLSGRSERSGYRLSLGYLNDGSQLQWGNNSNQRYNLRLSHDYAILKNLKLETNISLEKNDIVEPTMLGQALGPWQQPGYPISTMGGHAYSWGGQYSPSWQLKDGGDNKEYNSRIMTNFRLTYNLDRHFSVVGTAGYNASFTDTKTQQKSIQWYSYNDQPYPDNPGKENTYYQRSMAKNPYYNLNGYINYSNTFKDKHNVNITAGSQYERNEYDYYSARTSNLQNDDVPSLGLAGNGAIKTVNEAQNHWAIASFFSRLNYAYNGKYLFETNFRYDGSSRFINTNRWKLFYGFSGGWVISRENFLKDQKIVNFLKLRASYGVVGNQSGIGLYDYIQLLNVNQTTSAANSGFPIIGSSPSINVEPTGSLVSLNRTWENVQTVNVAVDFTTLNNRLNGTVEWFEKNNTNMLLAKTYSAILGASAPASNSGHLQTKGWELSLSWNDKIGKINYRVGGNISTNSTNLVDFGGQNSIRSGFNYAVEAQRLNSYFGLVYAGRIQNQKALDEYKQKYLGSNEIGMPSNIRIGDNMFADNNGDGKLTSADYKYLGRDDPGYSFSFNVGAEWNNFDISAIFQGVSQRTIYRRDYGWGIPVYWIWLAQSSEFYNNTWTPENPNAHFPRLATLFAGNISPYNYQPSTWSVENGAYLRLKNLVIGYTLPQQLTKKARIEKLRIYFSGNDLWEVTHNVDGWDPEATKDVGGNQRFPFYRYLTAGVNVTF